MSRYDFVSPGAVAGNAIQQFLLQRALAERQRMLDELNIQNTQADNARADEQMRQQRDEFAVTQQRLDAEDARRAEEAARKQSAEANTIGIQQMIGDRLQQGPVGPEDARSIAGMAYGAGLPVPGILSQALTPPKLTNVQTVDAKGRPIHKAVTEAELQAGVPDYVAPQKPDTSSEPLTAILGPDGQPVLVPRSQAVGKQPANAREQGRPVLSSDANKIASYENALSQLDSLSGDLVRTGAQSKLLSHTPNPVTEFTGIGEDAKKTQAMIDRVKQVIGKTLEGGVLRKEDEVKYEKILPTIGDPPEVKKAKLEGLRQAIVNQRQIELDNLTKANYDTSKFGATAPSRVRVKAPNGQIGTIPADQLQQALAQGFTQAE